MGAGAGLGDPEADLIRSDPSIGAGVGAEVEDPSRSGVRCKRMTIRDLQAQPVLESGGAKSALALN